MWKPKTVYAYIDGKKAFDVVDEALRLNLMASEMKKRIQEQYAGHKVEFKTEANQRGIVKCRFSTFGTDITASSGGL